MRRTLSSAIAVLLALSFLWGCTGGKSYVVKQYLPDYAPPSPAGFLQSPEVIRVEVFSTAQAYNGTAMVYRPLPFELNTYSGERWRIAPGELVTDFLLRDLRSAGAFKAVLSHEDIGDGHISLNGTVAEFLEIDGSAGPTARLSVDVTLLDMTQRETAKRVIFQKTYPAEAAMKDKTARALAEAMSQALKTFSGELLADMRREIGALKKAGQR